MSTITPIIYDVIGAGNVSITGLPTGLVGTFAGGQVVISGRPTVNPAAPTTFNYTIIADGSIFGCSSATVTNQVVVQPAPSVTLTSSSSTQIQTVCHGDDIIDVTFEVSNPAYTINLTDPTVLTDLGLEGRNYSRPQVTEITFAGTSLVTESYVL